MSGPTELEQLEATVALARKALDLADQIVGITTLGRGVIVVSRMGRVWIGLAETENGVREFQWAPMVNVPLHENLEAETEGP